MISKESLAKRAVDCERWRWTPGMKAVGRRNQPEAWFRLEEHLPRLTGEWSEAVPDLEDPATKGCILALVRERNPTVYIRPVGPGSWLIAPIFWIISRYTADGVDTPWNTADYPFNSESEALVIALELTSVRGPKADSIVVDEAKEIKG
jgi:hypothetical protein